MVSAGLNSVLYASDTRAASASAHGVHLRYGLFSQHCCSLYRMAAAAVSGSRELGLYRRTRCRHS